MTWPTDRMRRLWALKDEAHQVYIARDAEGAVLYIGCTAHLRKRLMAHRRSSAWAPLAATIQTLDFHNWWEAREAERDLIQSLTPACNRQQVTGPDRHYHIKVLRPRAAAARAARLAPEDAS